MALTIQETNFMEGMLRQLDQMNTTLNGIHQTLNRSAEQRKEEKSYITEFCPHCEQEIKVKWDPQKQGCQIFCPTCGNQITLCDDPV